MSLQYMPMSLTDVQKFTYLKSSLKALLHISKPDSPLFVLFWTKDTRSPFLLRATISKHLENKKQMSETHVIETDNYVDNVLSSFKNESDLLN